MGPLFFRRKLILITVLTILFLLPLVSSAGALSVNVSTNKTQYLTGETVSISGKVLDSQNNPVFGAAVSVQVNDPQNNPVHVQLVYSDQSGAYSDPFILSASSVQGQYVVFVAASKAGFDNAQAQTQFSVITQNIPSSSQTTGPPPNKCFIATATYGSELAPEVTLLRNFRDNDVLQTYAGRSFMLAFNAFYYSFSPQVASLIASHYYARVMMKIGLYPLIEILSLSSQLFKFFSFNSELAMTLSGIFAALAIGVVYLGPIMVAFSKLIKPRTASIWLATARSILISGFLSVVGIFFAGLGYLDALLTVTTVGAVLSFLVLGGFSVFYLVTRLSRRGTPELW